MPGSPITTSSARIRAAGASARPRCRPSLTRSHWRRRNSWPLDDAQQLNGTQTANSACQIKSQLIQLKGVGRVYQQTFIDTYAKVAFAKLYDRKTPITAAEILNDRVVPFYDEHDIR